MAHSSRALEFCALVVGVRQGDGDAIAQFSSTFERGARFLLRRYLATVGIENAVRECVAAALVLVRQSSLEPDRIPAALREMLQEHIAERTKAPHNDKPVTPELFL